MKSHFRRTLAETSLIVVVATLLGFLSTGIRGTGFFRSSAEAGAGGGRQADSSISLSYQEAQDIFVRGGAVFIDARHESEYRNGHIKGAINLPLTTFSKTHPLLTLLPRDQLIVTYCGGSNCSSSVGLAKNLRAAGYFNVKVFFGGWQDWRTRNQPIEP
jgi:rhodanese-related sulfurtransferase